MIRLTANCNDPAGRGQYIARIIGRDPKFTFEREFVGSKVGKRGQGTEASIDEPGLYEKCNITRKGEKDRVYRLIVEHDGKLMECKAGGDNLDGEDGEEMAMKIAKGLEQGRDFAGMIEISHDDEGNLGYRLLTEAQARRADRGKTLEQAEAACWDILQALPPKQAWNITKRLRDRLKAQEPAEAPADLERTTVMGKEVVVTEGSTPASGGGKIYGLFAREADARASDADEKAEATVPAGNLTDEQIAMARRNSERL